MKKKMSMRLSQLVAITMWVASMLVGAPALADNAVKLKVLVITTGDLTQDVGYAYIKPVLDEMGVPYDVLNAKTQDLTAGMLASSSTEKACSARDAGCVGNYNGIILTKSDVVPNFSPAEWDILHNYEKSFHVREAVLLGWPVTYSDPNPPFGVYLDYGLTYSSHGSDYTAKWTVPAKYSKEVFEYVNQDNPILITDLAFAANPRHDTATLRDGSKPNVVPLLRTQNDEALLSIVQYTTPSQKKPVRETLISTISNSDFLLHSRVLAYEFINWTTQGVFVGARFIHMAAHLDDLFFANDLWDPVTKRTSTTNAYRLNSADITNAVTQQAAFRASHPEALAFTLDFAFNGAGAVIDNLAPNLTADLTDDLVAAVVANKKNFRFINHTFFHAAMDKPVPGAATCDYTTFTTLAAIEAEITRNRTVWGLLGLPEKRQNERVLISGGHTGLKDRNCTLETQADDVAFDRGGANPLFLQAAARVGVDYLASDASQQAQDIEQYISQYNDGSDEDRIMLPRWPTNVFFNVINPAQLVGEYNYIFHDRFVNAGQDPCQIPGAACATQNYAQILEAEADIAVRRMLTFKKWPHYFHQSNLAKYDESGSTIQFDWLNTVFTEYRRLFKLPVKNFPYYLIGERTEERLKYKSAVVQAVWDRETDRVTLAADRAIHSLLVTGLAGGDLYGGQLIREVNIGSHAKSISVNRGLTR